ncbi:MAG: DUF4199 domain-containing protein [Bacteroidia bacterium]
MEQNKNLPVKMGLMRGAILGALVISIGIIRYKSGMIYRDDHRLSYLYWCIFTLTVFFAVLKFKKLNALPFSFGQTIKIGLIMGFISGTMYTIYIVILNNYIDVELSTKVPDPSGVMKMSSALRGAVYTLVCIFFGVLHSLISTFVVKRLKH